MNIKRLCGHVTLVPEGVKLSPLDVRWMATSDCEACRLALDWEPSDGHLSRTDFLRTEKDSLTLESIRGAVCRHFRITKKQIMSRDRQKRFLVPRHVGMYLTRMMTDYTYLNIAPAYGCRNHATVLHAVKKTRERIRVSESLCTSVQEIRSVIELGEAVK